MDVELKWKYILIKDLYQNNFGHSFNIEMLNNEYEAQYL